MSLPLIMIRPPVVSSRPATQFRSVDFPHPLAPSKTRKSPSSILILMSLRTCTVPNDFSTLPSSSDIALPLDRALCEPSHEELPRHQEQQQSRQCRNHDCRDVDVVFLDTVRRRDDILYRRHDRPLARLAECQSKQKVIV